MVEANYEFEQNGGTDGGSTQNLRRQEYWTALSGTTGQLYGSAYSWRLQGDWADNLDTIGILQLSYVKQLFQPRKWYDLVPDRDHQVLTHGFGHSRRTIRSPPTPMRPRRARRRHAWRWRICRHPQSHHRHVEAFGRRHRALVRSDATRFHRPSAAFDNTGTQDFTPPGNNSDGDGDWVLVLETD